MANRFPGFIASWDVLGCPYHETVSQAMSHPKHVVVGGLCLPLDVEALTSLPVEPGGVMTFDFVFRSIRFAVRYEEGQENGSLRLAGDLGPMPFTAESPAARAGLATIVLEAADLLGPSFRLAGGRILLGREFTIDRPVTACKLIAAVASMLVPAIPYLDLIAVYIRPPLAPAAPGERALRPEWRRTKAKAGAR